MFFSGITARGSFKRQIILAFVVGFFLLITAFSVYQVNSQKEDLYSDSSIATTGLAQSLAVSSLSWVLANDVVGLQEVVHSFQNYPELRYAMVISPSGRVLAHSDATKVGQFVADPQSLALLKAPPGIRILKNDASIADVAVPVSVNGRAVGWARVALGREDIAGDLRVMIWSHVFFVLSATILSLLAALLIANRLGSRIGSLVKVADNVRAGNMATRASIPGGADEITKLADTFNQMLNALALNEERLRAASLYTRSLIEASLDPLVTISAEGKITDVNQATESVTGRNRSELIGTDFSDYFTAPDKARAGYQQVFLKGSVTDYPLALRRRDGHVTEVLYNASVYQGENAKVLGVFAAARDITEQKRAEGARSQLAAIVESSSDAIIGKTLDGIITSWNKGAEKIYGYRADEIIGKPITTLVPSSLRAEVDGLLEKARNGEDVVNHESERIRKDGKRIYVALTLSPIKDDAGNISGISTIARDITERKLDEAALHQLNRELRAISSCNQTLMRAEDEQTLLDAICHIICEQAGYRMAWVGYAESDDAKTVRPVAWAGVDSGYVENAKFSWADDTERGQGPAGTAIRSGKLIYGQDFANEPEMAPWRENALLRGYRSGIALPLKDENAQAFGVLLIYSTEINAFVPDEIRLLEELSGDLAFGIMVLRTRNERKRVEQVLRESESDLKEAQRVAHTGSWDWDARTDTITWSEEYYHICGFDPTQRPPGYEEHLKAYTPESAARLDAAVKRNMQTSEPYELDLELVRPEGPSRWITARSETRRDDLGHVIGLRGTAQDITERKQAEEQLRHSEHALAEAQRIAHLGNWELDLVKNVLIWSDEIYRLFEIDPEKFGASYDAFLNAIHPDDRELANKAYTDSVKNKVPYDIEHRLLMKDGRVKYVNEKCETYYDEDGKPLRSVGTVYDITERKRAEEALRENEHFLEAIIEHLPNMLFVKDAKNLNFVRFNKAGEKLLGYSKDELIGKNDSDFFPKEQADFFTSKDREIIDSRELLDIPDELISTKYLGRRYLHTKKIPILAGDGRPLYLLGISEDITEHKLAEEALRMSEERLRLEATRLPIGYIVWDKDFRVVKWNPAAENIFGFSFDEAKGLHSYDFIVSPEVQPQVDDIWRRLLAGDESAYSVNENRTKDGRTIICSWTNTPLKQPDGTVLGVMSMIQDITERKKAEDELRRYKDHLEELVQQRTADLVLARNAAEAANRAKSVFLSSMSHELRTPMNAILGFSNMMRKDPLLQDEQRQNLDIINRSGEHLLTLINDVLEMAKIEAGRAQVESAPFDLGSLVRDVTDMMHVRAQEKGLQLLIDQSSEFPRYIKGDEARVRQVLINLLGNAVKFTLHGGVTVRFGLKPHATPQRMLIEVEDSGIGISAADQKKIFEPFVQFGETAAQQGTGLGLSIARQFVQLMGGTISFESALGKGSTFRVELPMERVASADVTKPESAVRGEIVGLAPGQPEYRILIVEDQLDNQLLLAKLMKNGGFQAKVAENGEQAVGLFQSWRPQLIWMDRRMPVMDGLEATRRIRELPGGREVKIVAVTASAFMEQRDEMLKAGMDDFVRKPYRFNEIYECMAKQLGVQYTYAEAQAVQEVSDVVLTAGMLAVLPPDLHRELHDAMESLEGERITAVIGQVASFDSKLHKTLSRLADNFDYPAILKALQTNPPVTVT